MRTEIWPIEMNASSLLGAFASASSRVSGKLASAISVTESGGLVMVVVPLPAAITVSGAAAHHPAHDCSYTSARQAAN